MPTQYKVHWCEYHNSDSYGGVKQMLKNFPHIAYYELRDGDYEIECEEEFRGNDGSAWQYAAT